MENTKIEWATHTFSPWIGCTKVSPGCLNCYAEADQDKQRGRVRWGKGQPRSKTSETYWKQPLKWNRETSGGDRPRIFPSLCDPFDPEVPQKWRDELANLISRTPNLDWLLLTKHPEGFKPWENFGCFSNVWLGVSVEDQKRADERIPILLKAPAKVRFLSVEPMLEKISFRWMMTNPRPQPTGHLDGIKGVDWVIVGGESGPKKRPFNPDWARELRDQCAEAKVSFFMKQMDKVQPIPEDLQIRQFPIKK